MDVSANPLTAAARPQPAALRGFWQEHAGLLITKPLQLLTILLIALLVRMLAHRWINRLSRASAAGRVPAILSPLTERAGGLQFWESSGLVSERRKQRADTIASVLRSAVSFLIFITAFLLVLQVFGISLAPFVAGTSLVGVAVGFGAQNIVKDFLSGMFMMLEDQYGVGDVIDVKEATGTVEAVGLRTTRLRDVEGVAWYVRNGEIVRVGNMSQQYAQVVLDVPVGIGQDVPAALAAISRAGAELYADQQWLPCLLAEPEVLGIEQLGRTETVLRLVARVKPLEQWRVARELRARIRSHLDGAGVGHALPAEDRA
ncbi:MAG TPA: mechanosensitive ion channel family protein [Jatrophihabitans sp.]|uniref:mechanosensitive ion channel family protein n=1 Tax=Jatrophihabitans sp. TaxID=1932789 RepID=UPI002F1AD890